MNMSCTGCSKHNINKNIISKAIDKVSSISTAYKNKFTGNITSDAKRKIAICKACTSKTKILGIDICKQCGCPIDIKPLSDKEFCKLNKW